MISHKLDKPTARMTEIALLNKAGLSDYEIVKITGTSVSYVQQVLELPARIFREDLTVIRREEPSLGYAP